MQNVEQCPYQSFPPQLHQYPPPFAPLSVPLARLYHQHVRAEIEVKLQPYLNSSFCTCFTSWMDMTSLGGSVTSGKSSTAIPELSDELILLPDSWCLVPFFKLTFLRLCSCPGYAWSCPGPWGWWTSDQTGPVQILRFHLKKLICTCRILIFTASFKI